MKFTISIRIPRICSQYFKDRQQNNDLLLFERVDQMESTVDQETQNFDEEAQYFNRSNNVRHFDCEKLLSCMLDSSDDTDKIMFIEALTDCKCKNAIPDLIKMLESENFYVVISAIISSLMIIDFNRTRALVGLYLSKINSTYEDLDEYHKFQVENRFLGYLLSDLVSHPSLIKNFIIDKLDTMCSRKNLAKSFSEVSYANSTHTYQWTSCASLLAKIGYQPAIDVILEMLDSEGESFSEALNTIRDLKINQAVAKLIAMAENLVHETFDIEILEVLSLFLLNSTLPIVSKFRNESTKCNTSDLYRSKIAADFYRSQIAVIRIQSNCKFYNYEIYRKAIDRKPPATARGTPDAHLAEMKQEITEINQRTKQMAEQPSTISISGGTFNAPVNLASNQGTQPTTIIGTQNNYFGTDETLLQQITDLQQLITELETQHPNLQTETQATQIVQQTLNQIQTQNPDRWQKLRDQMMILKQQFLNRERHAQALKATIVEVTKAKWEESLIVKAIVTYLDKFSETPDKGA